ncbi:uncharacterized protein LOC143856445 isoform X6 [Tasmannia lanceolata]|uniref:uncharacterized protein LOC143856445 isoform X6 n=1 Tax=Tasmannia lanceolata TaxID=3420 RepID=UPI0040637E96
MAMSIPPISQCQKDSSFHLLILRYYVGTYRKRKFNFFNGSFIPHRIVSGCSNKHLSDGILDMWLSVYLMKLVPSRNQLKIGWYFGKIHHCNAFYKGELGSY